MVIQKKEKRRKRICLLVCSLSALFIGLSTAVQVQAAKAETTQKGTIQVTLKDLKSENSSRENVEVDIYRVGTVDEHGKPEFDKVYGLGDYPQDTVSMEKAVESLNKKVTGEPDLSGKTDSQGIKSFSDVEPGIYLIRIKDHNSYGKVSPFLIHLPYYEELNGMMEGPFYEVKAEPKASPNKPEPPEEPKPPKEPETPEEKKPDPKVPDNTPVSGNAAKTGDMASVSMYLGMAAASLLGTGCCYQGVKRSGKQRKKEGESHEKE